MLQRSLHTGPAFRLLAATLFLFSAVGCEEPIPNPVELVESRIVISSVFSPNDRVRVRLSATQPATGELQVADIRTANVRLFEGPELIEELAYVPGENTDDPGAYETAHFQPLVGRRYTLLVNVDGMTPVTAESSIPIGVPISELRIENKTERLIGSQMIYEYDLLIDYADPDNETNFYDLRISQLLTPYRVNTPGDTTFLEQLAKVVAFPDDQIYGSGLPRGQTSILLRDKPTEGLRIRLQSRYQPEREILGNLVAELRTVVEPYYQFQTRMRRETGSGFGGAGRPPVNGYTNVQYGYGLFAGYNVEQREVSLP